MPIVSGEIGDDLAYYFTVSEQVPTAVALGVLVDTDISILAAGGLIIQMMPNENDFLADIVTFYSCNRLCLGCPLQPKCLVLLKF